MRVAFLLFAFVVVVVVVLKNNPLCGDDLMILVETKMLLMPSRVH